MLEAKRLLVQSWFTKAQHDLEGARKVTAEPNALYDLGVYHCQQAAEKVVKGYLVFRDQEFEKTHDIRETVKLAISYEPHFADWMKIAKALTPYAYKFRYPDSANLAPTQEEYEDAFTDATNLYNFVLSLVPAETHP